MRTRVAAGFLAVLLAAGPAYAQQQTQAPRQAPRLDAAAVERAVKAVRVVGSNKARLTAKETREAPRMRAPERSKGMRALFAAIGGAGGFFGGLFLGAAIEGDSCNCDDPGLVGALIGAPIGAAVGAITGWVISK
jgi:hypothetical protein